MLKNAKLALVALTVFALAGCQGSSKNPELQNVVGPIVTLNETGFLITVKFRNLQMDGGMSIPINRLSASTITVVPDVETNGTMFQLFLAAKDASDMLGGMTPMDPMYLPGPSKRPLPTVDGKLPGLAINFRSLADATIYGGNNLIGLFLPIKLGLRDLAGYFRFRDGAGRTIGLLGIIGEKVSQDPDGNRLKDPSGIMLLINFKPNAVAARELLKRL